MISLNLTADMVIEGVDLPGRSFRRLLQYFINLYSAPRLLLQTRLVERKCPCTEWSSIRYWEHSRAH